MRTRRTRHLQSLLVACCALSIELLVARGAAAAPQGEPAPPIRQVTVYADRAEVTRSAASRCTTGKLALAFTGLPTSVDVRTLRAVASGKARAIGTTHRIVPLAEGRDPRVASLEKERWELQDRREELRSAQRVLAARLQDVSAYGDYFTALAGEEARSERPDTARWARVLEVLTGERLGMADRQGELALRLRQVERQLDVVRRRLAHLSGQDELREALEVTVAVDCQGEGQPTVSLSYVVPGATWHPEYDLRFHAAGKAKLGPGKAELTVAAVVQQSSGEDWSDVKLTLSTARPRLGAEAPQPAPLYVRGGPAGKKQVLVGSMERRDKLAAAQEAPASPTSPAQAALEDRGQSFALVLPHRATIRSDGRPYWMPVDVLTAPAESALVAIPKLSPYVYQVARLANPASYPLLAGRIHCHRAGAYVGDATLEYKAPAEPMEVSLGIDEELHVERKPLEIKDRRAGLLSSTKHLERAYRIRLTNGAKVDVPIELREGIPVSKTREVRVELLRGETTAGFRLDPERGILSWNLPLAPGQESVVDLSYAIHLPEDWDVQLQ